MKGKETKDEDAILENCNKMIMLDTLSSDELGSVLEKVVTLTKETKTSKVDSESPNSLSREEKTVYLKLVWIRIWLKLNRGLKASCKGEIHPINKKSSDEIKTQSGNCGNVRANALEPLLELRSRLLKQDKLDELTFGHSRTRGHFFHGDSNLADKELD